MTITEALTDPRPPPTGPADTPPAAILGGAMLPAPLLAAKIAGTAKIVPITHPGDAPPQRRYLPTAVLATFIRCRDMTCRFPGCDEPAHHCDIDHTIAYPTGPTQASNLKCLCRKHHLLKTFGGWRDRQWPDGTVVWTCPRGQTYTTHPGSQAAVPPVMQTHRPRRRQRHTRHRDTRSHTGDAAAHPHPRPKSHRGHRRRTQTERRHPGRARQTPAVLGGYPKQLPFAGHTLERVGPVVLELES